MNFHLYLEVETGLTSSKVVPFITMTDIELMLPVFKMKLK